MIKEYVRTYEDFSSAVCFGVLGCDYHQIEARTNPLLALRFLRKEEIHNCVQRISHPP